VGGLGFAGFMRSVPGARLAVLIASLPGHLPDG
jgi:hypothetical protein